MTITISTQGPDHFYGPGRFVTLSSDFIGPLTSDARFVIDYHLDALLADIPFHTDSFPTSTHAKDVLMCTSVTVESLASPLARSGDIVYLRVRLRSPGTVDDGFANAEWDSVNGLWRMITNRGAVSGGNVDITAILNAVQRTFPSN